MPPSRSPRSSPHRFSSPLAPRPPTPVAGENEDNLDDNQVLKYVADNLEVPGNPKFKFNGIRFLFTYNSDELTVELIELAIQGWTLVGSWKICHEYSPETGHCYYVLIIFSDRLRTRDPKAYDIEIQPGEKIHPNIKSIRTGYKAFNHVYDHVTKGGDVHGPLERQEGGHRSKQGDFWGRAISASSRAEAREIIIDNAPRDYIKNFCNIKAFLHNHYSNDPRSNPIHMKSQYEFYDANLPAELIEWRDTQLHNPNRPKSLILVGPSRLGKSEWARSLDDGVAYMETDFDLSVIKADTTYLVISDIPNHKIGNQWVFTKLKGFFGCQDIITSTGKYLPNMTFAWRKPFIYLCNDFPDKWREDEWLNHNAMIVDIARELY